MLTQIKLKNFKIFKEETAFPLAKINLLTGINGRGKSSLLQSLLLMKQSLEIDESTEKLYLNGSCVRLGSIEDIKNVESSGDDINITYDLYNSKKDLKASLRYIFETDIQNEHTLDVKDLSMRVNTFFQNVQNKDLTTNHIEIYKNNIAETKIRYTEKWGEDTKFSINPNLNVLNCFFFLRIKDKDDKQYFFSSEIFKKFNELHYVSADRIGPKDFYLKENLGKFINVGAKGEMTANVLSHYKDRLVHDKLYKGEDAKTLLQQTEEWLKYILGNAKFTIDDTSKEVIYLLFNIQGTSPKYKPSNVGFGYSYILPIIVSGLIAQEGEILIVENPEAHLHPRAQSRLTEFLAIVASCGVQVFIESHSEHILHGLQIAAINQDIDISNEDISVLYFHEKEDGYFTQIPIKPNGKISTWPESFFDQTEKDLKIILGF